MPRGLEIRVGRSERGVRSITGSQEFALAPDVAFRAFSNPRTLDSMTPAWFRLHVLSYEGDRSLDDLGVDALIRYRLKLFGLPLRWTSRITEWDFPRCSSYRQERGPFLSFEHRHEFQETPGGTLVHDTIEYRSPGTSMVVNRMLAAILRYRFACLERLCAGASEATPDAP